MWPPKHSHSPCIGQPAVAVTCQATADLRQLGSLRLLLNRRQSWGGSASKPNANGEFLPTLTLIVRRHHRKSGFILAVRCPHIHFVQLQIAMADRSLACSSRNLLSGNKSAGDAQMAQRNPWLSMSIPDCFRLSHWGKGLIVDYLTRCENLGCLQTQFSCTRTANSYQTGKLKHLRGPL